MKTTCQHAETGHIAELPDEALPLWRGRGWVPIAGGPAEGAAPSSANTTPPTKQAARKRADENEE